MPALSRHPRCRERCGRGRQAAVGGRGDGVRQGPIHPFPSCRACPGIHRGLLPSADERGRRRARVKPCASETARRGHSPRRRTGSAMPTRRPAVHVRVPRSAAEAALPPLAPAKPAPSDGFGYANPPAGLRRGRALARPAACKPCLRASPQSIFGRVSNWWNGGGLDRVHSSVVAPSPQGLSGACLPASSDQITLTKKIAMPAAMIM